MRGEHGLATWLRKAKQMPLKSPLARPVLKNQGWSPIPQRWYKERRWLHCRTFRFILPESYVCMQKALFAHKEEQFLGPQRGTLRATPNQTCFFQTMLYINASLHARSTTTWFQTQGPDPGGQRGSITLGKAEKKENNLVQPFSLTGAASNQFEIFWLVTCFSSNAT